MSKIFIEITGDNKGLENIVHKLFSAKLIIDADNFCHFSIKDTPENWPHEKLVEFRKQFYDAGIILEEFIYQNQITKNSGQIIFHEIPKKIGHLKYNGYYDVIFDKFLETSKICNNSQNVKECMYELALLYDGIDIERFFDDEFPSKYIGVNYNPPNELSPLINKFDANIQKQMPYVYQFIIDEIQTYWSQFEFPDFIHREKFLSSKIEELYIFMYKTIFTSNTPRDWHYTFRTIGFKSELTDKTLQYETFYMSNKIYIEFFQQFLKQTLPDKLPPSVIIVLPEYLNIKEFENNSGDYADILDDSYRKINNNDKNFILTSISYNPDSCKLFIN